jgi:hypothetical protein
MRGLILHANHFAAELVEASTRPPGIRPERNRADVEAMDRAVLALVCVQPTDTTREVERLTAEIVEAGHDFATRACMVAPFAHLCAVPAAPAHARRILSALVTALRSSFDRVETSAFGYHKKLSLDIKGHPGAFRYREFSPPTRAAATARGSRHAQPG